MYLHFYFIAKIIKMKYNYNVFTFLLKVQMFFE